jgi:hypothetical protein
MFNVVLSLFAAYVFVIKESNSFFYKPDSLPAWYFAFTSTLSDCKTMPRLIIIYETMQKRSSHQSGSMKRHNLVKELNMNCIAYTIDHM